MEKLTKNLVTFKRLDGIKDEKNWYYEVHWKIQFLRGRVYEKPIYRENCLKRVAWRVCRFKGIG